MKKEKLSYKLLICILTFSSFVTIVIATFQLYIEYKRDISLVEFQIQQMEEIFLKTLSTNLWKLNYSILNMQLEGILGLPDIVYAEIELESGSRIFLGESDNNKKQMTRSFPINYNNGGTETTNLGTLHVRADIENVYARLRNRLLVVLASQMFKTFFVSLFILFIFHFLVTRHIVKLSTFAKTMDLVKLDTPLTLERKQKASKSDELDDVVFALNEMRERIHHHIIEEDKLIKQLIKSKELLEIRVKERTAELRESEERWQFALEGSGDGVWDWDTETNRVYFSTQWKSMLGFAPQEIGDTLDEWDRRVHPKDKAAYADLDRHFRGETQIYQNKHRLLCKDGSYKWILDRGKVISWTEEGKPLRIIGTHTDITETKQFEIALQRSHDEMESRVRERTLDLQKTHEQLLHAEKMSSIGKLSASIAHEFNNPLQGVMSVIQGVEERADMGHDDAELMDLAIKECHRMRDLIKSLQDFNRPTSARKAPMDIHAALESIHTLCKKEYATQKISITKKYAENLPQIVAVSDQLKQVFLNLLNNASDAFVHGGDITIETDSFKENVVIRFHDTGCGISPDDREHIFEPFFTTKAELKGTGLGLSVSYGIIKAHGGEITVDSEPGKGTTFSVILPIKGVPDEEKPTPPELTRQLVSPVD